MYETEAGNGAKQFVKVPSPASTLFNGVTQMRQFTKFEEMVLNFMDRANLHYRARIEKEIAAGNIKEAEEVLDDACERYTDWATD